MWVVDRIGQRLFACRAAALTLIWVLKKTGDCGSVEVGKSMGEGNCMVSIPDSSPGEL